MAYLRRFVEIAALALCAVASAGAVGCSGEAIIQPGAGGTSISDSQGVYVVGKLDGGPDRIVFVDYPNNSTPSVLSLPELAPLTNFWDLALSPQGDRMAISASSSGGITALFAYAVDGTAPVSLIDLSDAPNFGWVYADRLQFSPDGQWLAFVMDPDIDFASELYVVPVDGSAPPRRVSQAITQPGGVTFHAWSPDGQQLAYVADVGTGASLFVVDAMDPAAMPVALVLTGGTPGATGVSGEYPAWSSNSEQVYFISRHETGTVRRLYRANADGSGVEQVPGTGLTNSGGEASVRAWALSPDRSRLAFSSTASDAGLHQVYVKDLPDGTPAVVSAVQTMPNSDAVEQGPLQTGSLQWNPNGSSLAVRANWDAQANPNPNADLAVYVVPADGPAGGTRIMRHTGVVALMKGAGFSSDGQRLYVLADLLGQSEPELFTTVDLTTPDQDPLAARVFAPPTYDPILASYLPEP